MAIRKNTNPRMMDLQPEMQDILRRPDDWYEQLSNQSYPGHIRVHELAQQELGFIPQ